MHLIYKNEFILQNRSSYFDDPSWVPSSMKMKSIYVVDNLSFVFIIFIFFLIFPYVNVIM